MSSPIDATQLLDLPDEILVLIFTAFAANNFDNGYHNKEVRKEHRKALRALALTNKRIPVIVNAILLDDVRLLLLGPRRGEVRRDQNPNIDLVQYLIQSQKKIECVEEFRIEWCSRTPATWARDLFGAISGARDLKRLIVGGFDNQSPVDHRLSWTEGYLLDGLVNLQHIVLDVEGFDMSGHFFLRLCHLPKLTQLYTKARIYGVKSSLVNRNGVRFCQEPTTSPTNLVSLRCMGDYLDIEALRIVLHESPHLKALSMTLPGPGIKVDRGIKMIGCQDLEIPGHVYSPELLTEVLTTEPVGQALTSFVCWNPRVGIPLHDGSAVDFTSLKGLTKLTISIRLLCKTQVCHESHRWTPSDLPALSWYKRLPCNISDLVIYFDYSRGLLWNKADLEGLADLTHTFDSPKRASVQVRAQCNIMRQDFRRRILEPCVQHEITTKSRTHWITDLISHRFEWFTQLSSCKVIESERTGCQQRCRWEHVDLAKTYPEAFGCPEIGLELCLRAPPGFNKFR